MTVKFFVDTNVLVYAVSNAAADQARRDVAQKLLGQTDIVLSAQVLAEFYAVATSKTKLNMTHDDAVALLKSLAPLPVGSITRDLVMAAVELRQRYQISYWDAAIIAAAKQMGCDVIYSEDLNPGQIYDGVSIVNPFATGATP